MGDAFFGLVTVTVLVLGLLLIVIIIEPQIQEMTLEKVCLFDTPDITVIDLPVCVDTWKQDLGYD